MKKRTAETLQEKLYELQDDRRGMRRDKDGKELDKNLGEKVVVQENMIEELIAENSRLLIQIYQLRHKLEAPI